MDYLKVQNLSPEVWDETRYREYRWWIPVWPWLLILQFHKALWNRAFKTKNTLPQFIWYDRLFILPIIESYDQAITFGGYFLEPRADHKIIHHESILLYICHFGTNENFVGICQRWDGQVLSYNIQQVLSGSPLRFMPHPLPLAAYSSKHHPGSCH